MPSDAELIESARKITAELNHKYEMEENRVRFMFFTRRRGWNAGEGKWICRERKRGNLHEFNRLLRGRADTNFVRDETIDADFLRMIRYVITLDADTQMPRDAARALVGAIEHSLNRPVFDRQAGRVTEGYAILQPRVEISLRSASGSLFARIFSSSKGFDPYTTAVSDVYQDLFNEGSFVGKGLYDVDAFEAALERRIPENNLLSHDLFEGLYARVALLTDVALYDDYPSNYESYARRIHRWTRGDWQIARWLLPLVPNAAGLTVRNRLPLVARWKILDNLRRSLIAPALLLWFAFAWTFAVISPFAATIFALFVLTAPLYLHIAASSVSAIENDERKNYRARFSNLWSDIKTIVPQMFFRFAFLAHEATLACDAIARVFFRKFVSKKRLLEWQTAAQSEQSNRLNLNGYFAFMRTSPLAAVIIFAVLIVFDPQSLIVAAPFLILWTFAPFIAFRLSLPPGQSCARIESFMSHHQAMIFVSIGNLLHGNLMEKRFSRDPVIESADLLLQERVPPRSGESKRPRESETSSGLAARAALVAPVPRRFTSANQTTPQTCLLSNGNYTVMLTAAGSGFSRCGTRAVNRWREDAMIDNRGKFFYLRDARSGAVWSSGLQPTLRETPDYEVVFTESKAEFKRRDAGILTRTEIVVSTEDDAELRRVTVTNESARTREIEITSYAEIVLNEPAADEAHPAFSNLFVETEYVGEKQTLLARRKRSAEDAEI